MASYAGRLKDPHVCRIFFSSPFNGMEGEREELTKRYWPQIQSLCSSKGIQFVPVDMRWGITSELSSDFQTINICLKEIDRSDLFIGFFGQRYGWQGLEDEALQQSFDVAMHRYPWLEQHRNKSVTELEFLHGHLNNPGALPACILFRDKAYDDKMRAEAEANGDKRGIYKYSPESDLAITLMDDLKKRVLDSQEKTIGVHMSYADPKMGAKLMFDAIWKCLNEDLLKDITSSEGLSQLEAERQQHDLFCTTQCGIYKTNDQMMGALTAYVSNEDSDKLMVVSGEPGAGKTALLCNWIRKFEKHLDAESLLIYHFVGCTTASSSIDKILQRMVGELHEQMIKMKPKWQDSLKHVNTNETDAMKLLAQWSSLIQQLSEEAVKTVIVIDGLNSIEEQSKVYKTLHWLPEKVCPKVHLIVSTQTKDQKNLEELQNRGCSILEVHELQTEDIQVLSKDILIVRGKELSPSQLDKIVKAPRCHHPLFLRVLLEELCMFGKFRELDKKIDSLISCESTDDLFEIVIDRLERDYNSPECSFNIVEKVLGALFVSRLGLLENEVTDMYGIPSNVWAPLFFSLQPYLLNRAGFLSLARKELKAAVSKKYLETEEKMTAMYKEQLDYFVERHKWFTENGVKVPAHYITELPYLAQRAQDRTTLLKILCNIRLFEDLLVANMYQALEYIHWMQMTQEDFICIWDGVLDSSLVSLYVDNLEEDLIQDPNPAETVVRVMDNLSIFLDFAKYSHAMEHFLLRMKQILENNRRFGESDHFLRYNSCLYKLACLYCDTYDYALSSELHSKVLKAYEEKPEEKNYVKLGNSYHGYGAALLGQGNYAEAEEMFWKSIEMHQLNPDQSEFRVNKAKSLMNIAETYARRGDYQRAVDSTLKVLEIQEEIYQGQVSIDIAYSITNLGIYYRKLHQYDKAEEVYTRALKIKEHILGWYHNDVAIGCVNLSNLMRDKTDYKAAIEYAEKGLDIFKHIGHWESVEARNTKENLLLLYILLHQEGENLLDKGFDIYWDVFNSLKSRNELHLGLPYVHQTYMRYFFQLEKYEEVLNQATTLVYCDAMRNPLMYGFIYYIDHEVHDKSSPPQRPMEESLDTGLAVFPDDRWLIELKINHELAPARDLQGIIKVIDSFYSTESNKDSDNVEVIVGAQEACERADWKQGARALLEEYTNGKFAKSEGLLRNLAVLHHGMGNIDKSLECFERAIEVNPDAWILREKATFCHLMLGHLDEAMLGAEDLETRWPNNEEVKSKVSQIKDYIKEIQEKQKTNGDGQSNEQV